MVMNRGASVRLPWSLRGPDSGVECSSGRQRLRRAFALVELLTVVAIIAVLAAISYPVMVSAKKAAARTSCISNLRQYGVAIALYRCDQDGGECGTPSQMGLPPPQILFYMPQLSGLRCHGELHGPNGYHMNYDVSPPDDPMGTGAVWRDYVSHVGSSAILVTDPNHNPQRVVYTDTIVTAIGLRLDGSVVVRTRAWDGKLGLYWWHR
jgi:prepilin-type N-terminal cleavage/methylation domain-containing protein